MIRRTIITLCAVLGFAAPAIALTPIPPCEKAEGGMFVFGPMFFVTEASGLVIEGYRNLDRDGIIAGAPGPVRALDVFNGIRVTDCASGRMLALHGVGQDSAEVLAATEFLRADVQSGKRLRLRNVERAAKAVYGQDDYVRMIKLRETEETCACGEFFPGAWK